MWVGLLVTKKGSQKHPLSRDRSNIGADLRSLIIVCCGLKSVVLEVLTAKIELTDCDKQPASSALAWRSVDKEVEERIRGKSSKSLTLHSGALLYLGSWCMKTCLTRLFIRYSLTNLKRIKTTNMLFCKRKIKMDRNWLNQGGPQII